MATPVWLLNGHDLADVLGLTLTDDTTWRASTTIRRNPITIPGQHGVLSRSIPVFEEPKVTVDAWVIAASEVALQDAVDQVVALAVQSTLTLTRVSAGVSASARVDLVSIGHSGYVEDAASRIVMLFAVPGAFFRSAVWTSDDVDFAADLVNVEMPGLSGSTAPIADAVLRVTGPCTNPYFTDPTTGTGVMYVGAVAAGEYLYLCPKPVSARISTSPTAWATGGSDVSGHVTFPAAGQLQMWPVVQSATERKVLLSATGSGRTTATKIAVRGQAAYL